MKKINLVIFGCRDNTLEFIKTIDKNKYLIKKIVTINLDCAKKNNVSGYKNLNNLTNSKNLLISRKYNLSDLKITNFFKKKNFDIGISIGWQRIIPKTILSRFKYGVFGMHCSYLRLPNGKGRSPINWSVIQGYDYLYAQIFKYTDKYDDGPIIYSEKIAINQFENISEIQKKLALFFSSFLSLKYKLNNKIKCTKVRNIKKKNVEFLKRNEDSGLINLKKHSSKSLCDFVRAQSYPYPGAFFLLNKKKFIIDECKIFHNEGKFKLIRKNYHIFDDDTILFKLKKDYILTTKHRIKKKYLKDEYLNKIFL